MMRKHTRSFLFFTMAMPLIVWMACSDPQNAPTAIDNKVSVHPSGWVDQASPNFHGSFLAHQNYDASDCRQCHGNNFEGGSSEVSCRSCHASYPHPASFAGGHPSYIKGINYDLNSCQSCHGQDYGLKKLDNSCLTCHTQQGGPEACNTCHGNFAGNAAELKESAPPKGLDDETSSTAPAVGAHQPHFAYFSNLTTATVCQECHKLPQDFEVPGHIDDDARAEAIFGPLATLKTESGARVPNVTYDFSNNTCANSYCHGNWGLLKSRPNNPNDFIYIADKMEGFTASPKWTDPASAKCGSCHGLPPTGHFAHELTSCYICHQQVMDVNGNIIDKTKHVNGKINVFLDEYPMF